MSRRLYWVREDAGEFHLGLWITRRYLTGNRILSNRIASLRLGWFALIYDGGVSGSPRDKGDA